MDNSLCMLHNKKNLNKIVIMFGLFELFTPSSARCCSMPARYKNSVEIKLFPLFLINIFLLPSLLVSSDDRHSLLTSLWDGWRASSERKSEENFFHRFFSFSYFYYIESLFTSIVFVQRSLATAAFSAKNDDYQENNQKTSGKVGGTEDGGCVLLQ